MKIISDRKKIDWQFCTYVKCPHYSLDVLKTDGVSEAGFHRCSLKGTIIGWEDYDMPPDNCPFHLERLLIES